MRRFLAALLLALTAAATPALAVLPDEVLDDPVLEARARALSSELRCLICQNQSVDDSAAPVARDIRILLRERLVAGDTDEEIIDYLVDKFGQYVLLKPEFNGATAILWLAAPAFLIGGGILAFVVVRRRSGAKDQPPLTADEKAHLDRMLASEPADGPAPAQH